MMLNSFLSSGYHTGKLWIHAAMSTILQVEVFCMIPLGSERKVQVKIESKHISVRLEGEAASWLVKGNLLQAVEVHCSSWFIGE